MSDAGLGHAASMFLYHLSAKNEGWQKIPTGERSVSAQSVRTQVDGKQFSTVQAQQLAEAWGHEFLGEAQQSGKIYWRVKRKDAPPVDIVGGPARDIVRQSPRAQQEALRVEREFGVDVLDAQACYDLEKEAGEAASGRFRGWTGANTLFGIGVVFCGWSFGLSDTLPVSIPLGLVGLASFGLGFRPAASAVRRKRSFQGHLAKVEAIRRVVIAAEEEWRAGWRPDRLPG